VTALGFLIRKLRYRLLWFLGRYPEPNLRCMVCGGRHGVNDCSVDVGDL
jgi:hypothetical protein